MTFVNLLQSAMVTSLILAGCQNGSEIPHQTGEIQTAASHDDQHDNEHVDGHGDETDVVRIDAEMVGITLETAQSTPFQDRLKLPAEIRFDTDRLANLAPRVSGIVERLYANEGDHVERGATLALIRSRELASLKASWLTANARTDLAAQALAREEQLFSDQITSQSDLQAARAALAAAEADRAAAENELHAAGVSDAALARVPTAADGDNANSFLNSPIAGTVVRRTVTRGETVTADDTGADPLFTIVDESVVWADIAVFKQDLGRVKVGSPVSLLSNSGVVLATSEIGLVLPIINEASRTATARIVVDNPDGDLRPGQFVTAEIGVGQSNPAIMVPIDAVQSVENETSVFVPFEDGFKPRAVETGRQTEGQIEIVSGLHVGERLVVGGAFTLKAELEKAAFGDGHDH